MAKSVTYVSGTKCHLCLGSLICRKCGSSLFFDSEQRPTIGIAAGTVDQPSGLELVVHIFTADAADYTSITR